MACKLSANCNLIFGILSCNLPDDTTDVDLKVSTLWGIHMYKKDQSTQVHPLENGGKPFPSLQKKMVEFLRCRQIIATPSPVGHINPDLRQQQQEGATW